MASSNKLEILILGRYGTSNNTVMVFRFRDVLVRILIINPYCWSVSGFCFFFSVLRYKKSIFYPIFLLFFLLADWRNQAFSKFVCLLTEGFGPRFGAGCGSEQIIKNPDSGGSENYGSVSGTLTFVSLQICKEVLQNHIHSIRIRTKDFDESGPRSIWNWRKNSVEKNAMFVVQNFLGLHEGLPSYRRRLSKRTSST